MKRKFYKIAKNQGYDIIKYKRTISDMGPICFEITCSNDVYTFTYHCSYPFGQGDFGRKSVLEGFEERFKQDDLKLF
jgi:hypothetical protein